MEKFGKSQNIKRVEDVRFLTGTGRYIDDIAPKAAYFGMFLRSPVAHATIRTLNVADAREAPGIKAVYTAQDLEALGMDIAIDADLVDGEGNVAHKTYRPALAKGKINFVGEGLAFVVAETMAEARDALEMIEFEFDELEPKLDMAPGGPLVHADIPDNLGVDWQVGDAKATEAALAKAKHIVKIDVVDHRVIINPMEPRGCFAEVIDGGRLHFAFGGQGVWDMKKRFAKAFKTSPEMYKITTPDVGGGFGLKGFVFPEYYSVAAAAKALNHPVRWIADRTETMLADHGGRDLVSHCTMGFDENHRFVAYKVENDFNLGAYNSPFGQFMQSWLFARVMVGTYDIPNSHLRAYGRYTNTVQTDAYRGAGRPEAIYTLERMMDYAARELRVDPWEFRRKNFIPVGKFPYATFSGENYDVGDFNKVLSRVEVECDRAGFAKRRAESEAKGKKRGIGLCYYIESILGDPQEDATVEFCEDGTVNLYVGTQSNGQGHETVYAKFLSDQTGIPLEQIRVVQGDSDRIAKGGGTGGSRSVTVQTNATLTAVAKVTEGFVEFLAGETGADAKDISFDDERFRIPGSNLTPTMIDVAVMARAKGRSDLLKVHVTGEIDGRSYPNGAHVAEVEIDADTGTVTLAKYTVTDDFGNLISPWLAEGQVHGGVAQGVGQALMERAVYDESGQLLTATFMDYAMPRASDVPMIRFTTEPVPSTNNIMGMKGCGEAGTVGAMAAVGNAVMDALTGTGITRLDMPFTPLRVWTALNESQLAAE
jgi:aerobic carbon-monoxide dehydrogenase large subunit